MVGSSYNLDCIGFSLYLCGFAVGWVKRSEPTIYKYNEGGFGVKTNALIHPTHNLIARVRFVFICANSWLNTCSFKVSDNTNPFALPRIQDH